jgi:curved DNA-binding protein CbpA
MVKGIYDNLKANQPDHQIKDHFTIGIHDDVTHTSLAYDPAVLTYDSSALGSGSAGGSLLANTSRTDIGKLGIAVALPAHVSYAPGTQEVVRVTFLARPVTALTVSQINFGDQPTPRELINVQAIPVPATFSGAAVEITPGNYEADVAPWEVVLGTQISVPTLESRVNIKIPPGTQNGQRLRVRSQGLAQRGGGRGDLIVKISIRVPDKVEERERVLWEQLARESKFNPRG